MNYQARQGQIFYGVILMPLAVGAQNFVPSNYNITQYQKITRGSDASLSNKITSGLYYYFCCLLAFQGTTCCAPTTKQCYVEKNSMLELPMPNESEQQHSAQVVAYIQQQIGNGTISFADYMQSALYAPGLGYYVNGKIKFGAEGDFVTSPEISPAFSYCIAKQAQQVLALVDKPVIFELGAGSGAMAADILIYLEQQQCLPREYWILETSPSLQHLQRQTLQAKVPQLFQRVKWLSTLPEQNFSGVIVANEVLDALSVHRFTYDGEQFQELVVNDQLHYQTAKITDATLQVALEKLPIENFDPGYQSEVNLWLAPWLASVTAALQQGIVLLIDYGYPRAEYYHPQRNDGTLLCYYRHRAHADPFFYPGIQDITAHVDFTAVAEAADAAKLQVAGFCHQAAFLLSCGIQEMAVDFTDIKQLVMPAAMGEIFKVMALTRDVEQPLLGFNLLDQRSKL